MFLVLVPRPAVAQSSRAGRKQAQKVAVDSSELRVFYSFCRAIDTTGIDTSCRPIFIYDDRPADAKVRNVKRMKIVPTTRERVRTLQTLFWKDPVYLNELHGVISAVHDRSGRIVIRKSGEVQLPFIPPLELE